MVVKKKKKQTKQAKRAAKKPAKKRVKKEKNAFVEDGSSSNALDEDEIKKAIEESVKREISPGKDVISTGFKNFDEAIGGGFPSPSAIVVEGPPSEYKVPFLIGFVGNALKRGRKSIYICTNDFPENIIKIGKKVGYDLTKVEFIDAYSWMIGKKSDYPSASALNPNKLIEVFSEKLNKNKTECIVFDSLSTLFLYHDKSIVEKFTQMLVALTKDLNAFLLISVESGTYSEEMEAVLRYLTDGVIVVEEGKILIKYIEGVKVGKKEMRLDFSKKGIEID